jgi:hypothetical protein
MHKERLHFGGLWRTDHDQAAEFEAREKEIIPAVIFFLGDDFMLVTRITYEGDKVTNLDHSSFIYDVEPDHLKIWPVKGKKAKLKKIQWRLINYKYLELKEKENWLRYLPTSIEEMEKLGVPRVYFETWIDVFENQMDSFAILRPLVPEFTTKKGDKS